MKHRRLTSTGGYAQERAAGSYSTTADIITKLVVVGSPQRRVTVPERKVASIACLLSGARSGHPRLSRMKVDNGTREGIEHN